MKIKQKTIKFDVLLGIVVSLTFLVGFNAKATVATSGEIIDLVNQERKNIGLNELVENPVLTQAAQMKAQDMVGHNYFSHTSPSGVDPWYWFEQVNYKYKYAGENLAMDFSSALSVHKAWMKSQTHKDNILSDKYQEIGVAVLSGVMEDRETQVAVQLFGTRLSEELLEFNGEVKGNFNDLPIKINETSLSPWKGSFEDEMLVFAEIEGQPEKVEAVIGKNIFVMEELRENIYINLVSLDNIDLEKEQVILKATLTGGNAMFYPIPKDGYQNYLAQKEKEKEEAVPAGVVGQINDSNSTIAKWEYIFKQNILLIIITGVFLVTIINIWILEKEEENLLKTLKSA